MNRYPLVIKQFAIENGHRNIVDLPNYTDFPYFFLFTRVVPFFSPEFSARSLAVSSWFPLRGLSGQPPCHAACVAWDWRPRAEARPAKVR